MKKLRSAVIAGFFASTVLLPFALWADTPSGQLTFSLRTAGPPVQMAAQAEAPRFTAFKENLLRSLNNGPAALALIRQYGAADNSQLISAVSEAVEKATDPSGKWDHIYDFIGATENEWALPVYQYAAGDESDEEPVYVTVNRELRDGQPDSDRTATWTKSMREAMWRLPRFEGISFRGTRLKPDRIGQYYPLAQRANDPAFISTSLSPETAFKFADPEVNGSPEDEKISVVFVVIGKTGRPVSSFAHMHSHEQEILFANGTPMTTVSMSPVFEDNTLKRTQILVLEEN